MFCSLNVIIKILFPSAVTLQWPWVHILISRLFLFYLAEAFYTLDVLDEISYIKMILYV